MQSVLRNANDIFADNGETTPSQKSEEFEEMDTQIIAKSYENNIDLLFKQYAMTTQRIKELREMKYVIDGLFVDGYHSYLYGASGSGKTTIMLNLCFEMVERGYTVYFFYLDGELFSASRVKEEIDRRGISDKYFLLTEGTMLDYSNILQALIGKKESLANTVFILDTFKFLSEDVNHKNANKKAMHFIKDVCKLGATFISLGHTNKDGKNQSGTAEIEQDSDALLKIDSTVAMDDDTTIISTIQKGGRCRCNITKKTFEFEGGNPLSVAYSDKDIDVQEQSELQRIKNADMGFIIEVKRILFNGGEKTQTQLLEVLNDFDMGKTKKISKLKFYIGKEWEEKKGEKNASIYFLKDDFMKQWREAGRDKPINEEPLLFS